MIEFKPLMPVYLLLVYLSLASAVLVLCMLSFVAVYRTKKTPYATKLLSLGLLTYDIFFLVLSFFFQVIRLQWCVPHLESYQRISSHRTDYFGMHGTGTTVHLKSNWPYVYIRVANECRTKMVCIAVVVFGFLQYATVGGAVCYDRCVCVCEFGFNVAFNNFSVISRRCLVATGSSMLTFIVLPHWSITCQTLDMIPHPVTLSWHWVDQS